MLIKEAIQKLQGFQFMIDELSFCSPFGKRFLLDRSFATQKEALEVYWTEQTQMQVWSQANPTTLDKILLLLMQMPAIEGSVALIAKGYCLSDVDFFELKKFALLSERVKVLLKDSHLFELPSLLHVVDLLDPDGEKVIGFYIYDSYSVIIAQLRKEHQKTKDEKVKTELWEKIQSLEDKVRADLSEKLQDDLEAIKRALQVIGELDIVQAQLVLNKTHALHRPTLVETQTRYQALVHPQIKEELKKISKKFQPVSIAFTSEVNVITGINMGGKTVVLNSLALAQFLCQFGFFVPAEKAEIMLVDRIMWSIADQQNALAGLSSYAAEMLQVNDMLLGIKKQKCLLLIDELARTTNPTEGRALVCALIELLNAAHVPTFITTHYDDIKVPCRRLRVKGFSNPAEVEDTETLEQYIDYSLVEDTSTNVPHEALRIAQMLKIEPQLITLAQKYLNKNNQL